MIILHTDIIQRKCPFKLGEKILYKGKKYKVIFRHRVIGLCEQYFLDIRRKNKILTVHETYVVAIKGRE